MCNGETETYPSRHAIALRRSIDTAWIRSLPSAWAAVTHQLAHFKLEFAHVDWSTAVGSEVLRLPAVPS